MPASDRGDFQTAYAAWLEFAQNRASLLATPSKLNKQIARLTAAGDYPMASEDARKVAATLEVLDQFDAEAFVPAEARAAAESAVAALYPPVKLIWPETGEAFDPELHIDPSGGAGSKVAKLLRPGLDARAGGGGVTPARITRGDV